MRAVKLDVPGADRHSDTVLFMHCNFGLVSKFLSEAHSLLRLLSLFRVKTKLFPCCKPIVLSLCVPVKNMVSKKISLKM